MSFDFRLEGIKFDQTKGKIQTESVTATFGSKVNKATAAINGFDVRFATGDHPINRQIIDISDVQINSNTVTVTVRLLLRDASGNIDDAFGGAVDVAVLADVA